MLDGAVTSRPTNYRYGGLPDCPNPVGVSVYRCGNYRHIPVERTRVFCQILISHDHMGCQSAYRSCLARCFQQAEPSVCRTSIAKENGVVEIEYQRHFQTVYDPFEYRRAEECGLSKDVH